MSPISPTLHLGRSHRTLLSHLYLLTRHHQPIHFSTTAPILSHLSLSLSLPLISLHYLITSSDEALVLDNGGLLLSSSMAASHARPRRQPPQLTQRWLGRPRLPQRRCGTTSVATRPQWQRDELGLGFFNGPRRAQHNCSELVPSLAMPGHRRGGSS